MISIVLSLTAAPSGPTDVTTNVTNTTISVCWGPPDSDGGRDDLYYRVELCPVLSCTDDSRIITEISSCSGMIKKTASILLKIIVAHGKFCRIFKKMSYFYWPTTSHPVHGYRDYREWS